MSQRILILDDDEHIRLLLGDTLSDHYEPSLYATGESAIEAIHESLKDNQPFTVAITDLYMPGMNGIEAGKKMLEVDDRINLILMTADTGNIIEMLDPSLQDNVILIRKPFSLDEVIMLNHYLHKSWHLARTLEQNSIELERRVRQSEKIQASMTAIFKTALDCIITINHKSEVVEWNPAAEKTFGWSKSEILGKKLTETIVPAGSREGHLTGMMKHLQYGGGPILGKRIEIVAQNRAGETFPVELSVTEVENKAHPSFTAYLRDISTQKEAEQQMILQSKTLEAAANGIVISDIQGNIIWANPSFSVLTGYDSDEVIGLRTNILKSGKHPPEYYKQLWDTILAGEVWQGEIINQRKDGSHYIEEMTITPITDAEDQIINFIAIKQDITERKKVNEQLVHNEQSQRIINYFATSLAKSNTVEGILWDIAISCISEIGLEDAVVYLLDESRENLVQRAAYGSNKAKDYKVLNPLSIPIGQGIVGHAAMSKTPILISDVEKDPRYIVDDEMRGSELAVPIIFENQIIGVIDSEHPDKSFFQDFHLQIFEAIASLAANKIMRIVSQERTQRSEAKYRSIFESIQDVYAEVDIGTAIVTEISPSIKIISGYTRDEIIGRPVGDFFAPSNSPVSVWDKLLKEGHVNDFEATLLDKGGEERIVAITVSVIKDKQGDPIKIVGTMRDIRERKRAEIALQNNLAIKTNFVSNVSHELRTPMASILGYAGTILRDKEMPDETKMDFVRIINEEAKRLTRLIENVLDISRMEVGNFDYNFVALQLEDIIAEVVKSQSVLAKKNNLELTLQIDEVLPPVLAESDAMNQVAVNLISNAIKFTESPGTIEVRLFLRNDHIIFEVRDSGLGIPEKDLLKIFEKFYRVERAKREDQGTGIGLAIVKEIVDKHNAQLEIESTVGVGTTFQVIIPALTSKIT